MRRAWLLPVALGAALALGLVGHLFAEDATAASSESSREHRVGHMVKTMTVQGSFCQRNPSHPTCSRGEPREVLVHLWYPADQKALATAEPAVYQSRLHGLGLPNGWSPLSWQVRAEIAGEAPIDPQGQPLPVIVFSHGSANDPIDYAHTLERIAGRGFVVAAPYHVNNTQEDVRTDFLFTQNGNREVFKCKDGRPRPCNRAPNATSPELGTSMRDRVNDISAILDNLDPEKKDGEKWLGDRVDVNHTGVMGHSRGTVTALSAAGGSDRWDGGFPREPRVKAIMGLAIGAQAIIDGANVAKVGVPSLLVAGGRDENTKPFLSQRAYANIGSSLDAAERAPKAYFSIEKATHRSFDSTYCDQLRAAGIIASADSKAILDRHTVEGIAKGGFGAMPNSGKATQYCSADTFPEAIQPLVTAFTPFDFKNEIPPTEGLDTDEVKEGVTDLASSFFATTLKSSGNDGAHFTRYLAPEWLGKHEEMVDSATVDARGDAICPDGQCDANEESPEAGQ